jgi:Tol biopolymer transport system component
VQVTPETMTLGVSQRQPIFATAYDRQGNLIANAKFTFWSSDTLVARVQRDGSVVGVSPGLAKVEARVQGRRASLAVLITAARTGETGGSVLPAGSVLAVDPASLTLLPGERVPLSAHALQEDGTAMSAGRISWKTTAREVAEVDTAGVVTGVGPGRTVVQASASRGVSASVPVTVEPADFAISPGRLALGPEEMDTLRAVVPAQINRLVRGGLQWASSDTSVATVGPTGIVTGRGPGQAVITAVGFAQERTAAVTVHRIPQALVVSPRPSAGAILLPVNGTRELSAVAEATDSTPIPEARLEWSVGDTSIIAFDAARRSVSGKTIGSTTVTVRLRGFEPVVWSIQVVAGLLGLEQDRLGIQTGARDTLAVQLVDESGTPGGPATGLEWSSDRPDVARVSGEGIVDGMKPGRATVTAKAPWGRSVTAQVLVTGELLASSNRSGAFGIYQLRAVAGEALRPLLVDNSANVQARLSPDRTRIAFSSNRGGSYDLYVADADGANRVRLTSEAGAEGEPVWTPDGSRIIYTATARGGQSQLRSVGADGKEDRALTTSPGGNHSPAVSADGRSIVFVSARDGNQEIYVMELAGGEPRRITKSSGRESSPHFLPNGDLLYVSERGGRSKGSRVVRQGAGTAAPTQVLETEQPITSLGLARDGSKVAYVVGRLTDAARGKGQFSLFVQRMGGAPEQIPLGPGEQVASPAF